MVSDSGRRREQAGRDREAVLAGHTAPLSAAAWQNALDNRAMASRPAPPEGPRATTPGDSDEKSVAVRLKSTAVPAVDNCVRPAARMQREPQ